MTLSNLKTNLSILKSNIELIGQNINSIKEQADQQDNHMIGLSARLTANQQLLLNQIFTLIKSLVDTLEEQEVLK